MAMIEIDSDVTFDEMAPSDRQVYFERLKVAFLTTRETRT